MKMSTLQKFLAEFQERTEARDAMSRVPRLTNRGSGFVATCVAAAFLWTLALSASPQLHVRVHGDANRVEHTCAVTLITAGSYNHSAHVPLVSGLAPVIQFSKIPALTPRWVELPFLGASIFEHAPPAHS